jgi:hypothetical protein
MFHNKARYFSEELSTPCPNPKLEDCLLSAVRGCLFSIFAVTLEAVLHPQAEDSPCRGDRDPHMSGSVHST